MAQEFQTADEFHGYLRNKAVEDEAFRARLLSEPKAVMEEELDMKVPDDFTIEVHENTANTAHLVLPPRLPSPKKNCSTSVAATPWTGAAPFERAVNVMLPAQSGQHPTRKGK